MFWFHKEDVYIGYSMAEMAKVVDVLSQNRIKYANKVVNHSRNHGHNLGSFGSNSNYEFQYTVSVHKKDYEQASYLVNRALHS